jgi:hypothetical protein
MGKHKGRRARKRQLASVTPAVPAQEQRREMAYFASASYSGPLPHPEALLRAVVVPHRDSLPPSRDIQYRAFADAASGSGGDSFAFVVGHQDANGKGIIDKLVEIVPPFSPDAAVRELAAVAQAYRVGTVTGDRWVRGLRRSSGAIRSPIGKRS